jgi:hypothetical protein
MTIIVARNVKNLQGFDDGAPFCASFCRVLHDTIGGCEREMSDISASIINGTASV